MSPLAVASIWAIPRLRLALMQRVGCGPRRAPDAPRCILFHAASAGDVRAVAPVLERLRGKRPTWQTCCTVQTRSGMALARSLIPEVDVTALPVDAWPWVDWFVGRLRPDVLVLEYLELWPRLLWLCKQRGARTALQNGRIHPNRLKRYQSTGALLLRSSLASLDWSTARSAQDAQRLRDLGVKRVWTHTHTKHATLSPLDPIGLGNLLRKNGLALPREHTWLAGSAHVDEADLLCSAHAQLGAPYRLLIVPRYPEHGGRFASVARRYGLSVARLPREGSLDNHRDVVVLETVGELATLYGACRVAVVGGTFGGRGGQNPLEPALAGSHVVVGTHTTQIEPELEQLGPDISRATRRTLVDVLRRAFRDDCISVRGLRVVEEARLAVEHLVEEIILLAG